MIHATPMSPTTTIAERAAIEKRVVLIIMQCIPRIKIITCRLMVREIEGSGG